MKLSKEAFITSASNIAASLIYISAAFLVTKTLGPYNKGIYTLFTTFCAIVIIVSNLSLNSSSAYFAALNKSNARSVLSRVFKLSALTSMAGIMLTTVAFFSLRHSYFASMDRSIAIIFLIAIPAGIFLTNTDNFLLGIGRIKAFGYVTLLKALSHLTLISIFVFLLKYQSLGATVAYALSLALAAIVSSILCRSEGRRNGDIIRSKDILLFGLRIHPTNLVSILEQRIDVVMLGLMLGPASVGLYSLSTAFAETGLIIPNSLTALILPKAAADNGTSPKNLIKYSLVFTIIYSLVIFISCSYLIRRFFGEAFVSSITSTKILAFAAVFFGFRRTLVSYIFGKGKAKLPLIATSISLVLNISLNYFLIRKHGINGAAISSIITYLASLIIVLVALRFKPLSS